ILDPSSNTNPLLNNLDPDSESSAEEDESDGSGEEDDYKESSDDGMTDFEEDEEEEKVNDKLRRAVIEALGDTGAVTDVESVDLDDMDEEEGARVDKALSEAFKALKPLKNKKQPLHAKALTHFRLRVLDLVEVWLASEPPLDLLVDTLLRLISLLEHSLVDRYQAPLETRVRSVIKKLTAVKKYDVSDCKSLPLGNILKSLLEKGDRTTTVYMSVSKELTDSTLFIVKASQQIDEINSEEDSSNVAVLSVLKDSVKSFFLQSSVPFHFLLSAASESDTVPKLSPGIWNARLSEETQKIGDKKLKTNSLHSF
ncbi:Myb-binding protein 1A, partial [Homalodisca vitripennis]